MALVALGLVECRSQFAAVAPAAMAGIPFVAAVVACPPVGSILYPVVA